MRSRRGRRIGLAMASLLPAIAVLAGLAGAAGCRPMLAAESSAPAGRSARLDEVMSWFWGIKSYRLELSQGVALAVSCSRGGPCEKLVATSDDPAVADVRSASLSALRPAGLAGNQAPTAAVVIVGKTPGVTTIRLRSHDGDREIRVTVVAPPAAPVATTVAR
jgi:hypothetical protein